MDLGEPLGGMEGGEIVVGIYYMRVKAGILVMKGLSRDASRDKKMGKGRSEDIDG